MPGGLTPELRERVEGIAAFEDASWRQAHGDPFSSLGVLEVVGPGPSAAWEEGRLDAGGLVPHDDDVRRLAVAGFVAAVAAVVFALALATVDRRVDDELLVVLGAPAGLRRLVGSVQAGVLAAVGATVAVTLGTLATAVGFGAYNDADTGPPPIPFVFPWPVALLLLVALPLVVAGLTSLLTPTIRSVDLHRLAD